MVLLFHGNNGYAKTPHRCVVLHCLCCETNLRTERTLSMKLCLVDYFVGGDTSEFSRLTSEMEVTIQVVFLSFLPVMKVAAHSSHLLPYYIPS